MERSYHIAGLRLSLVPARAELAAFETPGDPATPGDLATGAPASGVASPWRLPPPEDRVGWRRQVDGLLGGTVMPVEVEARAGSLALRLPGGGELTVSISGETITTAAEGEPSLARDAALGPGLCLALAMRGIVCLHASAALHGDALCVFVGESGAGKSTLAAALDRRPGWRRVADDCLPVLLARGDGGEVVPLARPRFPQLKLSPAEQWPADAPAELPIRRLYHLGAVSSDRASITITPATLRRAGLILMGSTAAARLFPPRLLSWHLEWASTLAARAPLASLSYPRRLEHLPEVLDAVSEDLSRASAADARSRSHGSTPETLHEEDR